MSGEACPICRETNTTLSPSAISSDANVCRRSWNRSFPSSARSRTRHETTETSGTLGVTHGHAARAVTAPLVNRARVTPKGPRREPATQHLPAPRLRQAHQRWQPPRVYLQERARPPRPAKRRRALRQPSRLHVTPGTSTNLHELSDGGDPLARREKNRGNPRKGPDSVGTRLGGSTNLSPGNHRGDPRVLHSPPDPKLGTPSAPRGRCEACGVEVPSGPGVRGRRWCVECSDGHGQLRSRDRRKVRRRCSSCSRFVLAEACTRRPSCDRCRALPRSCSECPVVLEGGQRVVCSPTCAERRRRRLRPEVEAQRQRRKRARRRERLLAPHQEASEQDDGDDSATAEGEHLVRDLGAHGAVIGSFDREVR